MKQLHKPPPLATSVMKDTGRLERFLKQEREEAQEFFEPNSFRGLLVTDVTRADVHAHQCKSCMRYHVRGLIEHYSIPYNTYARCPYCDGNCWPVGMATLKEMLFFERAMARRATIDFMVAFCVEVAPPHNPTTDAWYTEAIRQEAVREYGNEFDVWAHMCEWLALPPNGIAARMKEAAIAYRYHPMRERRFTMRATTGNKVVPVTF
jgi:hypothetical protein